MAGLGEILDELTSRGVIDPARLYEPPFSDLAPSGPEGLFLEATVCVPVHNIELRHGSANNCHFR